MAEIASPPLLLSVEEFLAFEDASSVRHEYVDGELYAFAGASWWHNRIAGNIFRQLSIAADDGPCTVFISDMKLRAAERLIYYPDVVVSCDPDEVGQPVVTRPCFIVEVLSPSTESIDRREKLMAYRAIETLRAYLVVYTEQRRVVHHWRDEQGAWQRADVVGDGTITVPCPETELALSDIYRGVEIPAG